MLWKPGWYQFQISKLENGTIEWQINYIQLSMLSVHVWTGVDVAFYAGAVHKTSNRSYFTPRKRKKERENKGPSKAIITTP